MVWHQFEARTKRRMSGQVTSTLIFWKSEHDDIDKDNVDARDLQEFLVGLSKGHLVECEATGESVDD